MWEMPKEDSGGGILDGGLTTVGIELSTAQRPTIGSIMARNKLTAVRKVAITCTTVRARETTASPSHKT